MRIIGSMHGAIPRVQTGTTDMPPLNAEFVGRATDLTRLDEALRDAAVTVVSGLAGVGKTALALKAARGFTGRVLFLDLKGYTDHVQPDIALTHLLIGLGVPQDRIPGEQSARESLYRARLDEEPEPVLAFLDNASTATQVCGLLPGSTRHRVLVTSRHTLADLNARLIELDVLTVKDAIELVSTALTTRRPDDTRTPTEQLVLLAGRLPLALSIVAAVLADDTTLSIDELTRLLHSPAERLDELQMPSGDHGVRRAFDLSYARLSTEEQRLFRMLSIAFDAEVDVEHAAALSGHEPKHARKLLSSLRRAHLLEHGRARNRFRSHDLIRLYAAELAGAECEPAELNTARERLIAHLTAGTTEAIRKLLPTKDPANRFTEPRDAIEWLNLEWPMLINLIEASSELKRHDEVAELIPYVLLFAQLRSGLADWSRLLDIGMASAQSLGDRRLEALVHQTMSYMHIQQNNPAAAKRSLTSAFEIFNEIEDSYGAMALMIDAAMVARQNGDLDAADEMYRTVLDMYVSMDHWLGTARVLFELGCLAHERKDLSMAETHLLKSAGIAEDHAFAAGVAYAMTQLGIVQNDLEQPEQAVSTFKRAQGNAELTGDVLTQVEILYNLARSHCMLDNLDDAILSLRQAKRLYLTINEDAKAEELATIIAALEDQVR